MLSSPRSSGARSQTFSLGRSCQSQRSDHWLPIVSVVWPLFLTSPRSDQETDLPGDRKALLPDIMTNTDLWLSSGKRDICTAHSVERAKLPGALRRPPSQLINVHHHCHHQYLGSFDQSDVTVSAERGLARFTRLCSSSLFLGNQLECNFGQADVLSM